MRILIQVILPFSTNSCLFYMVLLGCAWSGGLPNWEEGKWFWFILLGIALSVGLFIFQPQDRAQTLNTRHHNWKWKRKGKHK